MEQNSILKNDIGIIVKNLDNIEQNITWTMKTKDELTKLKKGELVEICKSYHHPHSNKNK
jgi:hypothetical protein